MAKDLEFKVYRFVGREALLGGIRLFEFGKAVKIEVKTAEDAIRGGVALIEDGAFQAIGFTETEIKVLASSFMSDHEVPAKEEDAAAKALFLEKKAKAQGVFIANRHDMLDPIDRPLVDNTVAGAQPPLVQEYMPEPKIAPKGIQKANRVEKEQVTNNG